MALNSVQPAAFNSYSNFDLDAFMPQSTLKAMSPSHDPFSASSGVMDAYNQVKKQTRMAFEEI